MEGTIAQRDYTWDALKFVLIVFVILGHWLEYGLDLFPNRAVFNYVYLFHMPLFIFISGYFSKRVDKKKKVKDILFLIETYIAVQAMYVVSSHYLQHKPFSWQQLYMPNAAAWYLMSLISWRIVLWVLPIRWIECRGLLPFLVFISLMAGFIPVGNGLSLQRTLAFMPFFFGGYLMKGKIGFGDTTTRYKWLSIFVLVFVFGLSLFMLNRNISYITYCKSNYYTTPTHSMWMLLLLRFLFLTSATVLIFCILNVFPRVSHPILLSRLGRDTLFYYVYHIIFMRVGIICIRHFHLSLSFPDMLVYTFFCVFILFLIGNFKLLRWLLNPVSSILKKFSNDKKNYKKHSAPDAK